MGGVVGWVAHEILVSAQGPLVFGIWVWGLGVWGLGLTIVRLRFHHPRYSECHFPLSDFLYSPEVIIILDDGVSDLNAVHAPVPEGLIIIIGWYILR